MIPISKRLKNKLILIGIITTIALLIGDLYYQHNIIDKKEISKNIYVENNTNYDIEFKTKLILNKILNIDSIHIKYIYMNEQAYLNNFKIGAYIIKNPFFDNQYLINISKTLKPYHIDIIISHELIHVHQYETLELENIDVNLGKYRFKNDTIVTLFVPYRSRGYEIDAYSREDNIYNKLQILLEDYKK